MRRSKEVSQHSRQERQFENIRHKEELHVRADQRHHLHGPELLQHPEQALAGGHLFFSLHPIEELFIAHADGGQGDGLVPAGGEDDLPCQAGGDGVGGGDGHQDDWDHSHQK